MEWALAGNAFASSAWQVAHCTLAIFGGCGNSLMEVWQSLQPRTACAPAACLAGSMEMLLPALDFIPASPWQARHSWSVADEADAQGKAKTKIRQTIRQTTATRVARISTPFYPSQAQPQSTQSRRNV